MAQTITGGTWYEDFNYGYPYGLGAYRSYRKGIPAEFTFSGTEHTPRGALVSTKYARTSFAVHYLNAATDPNNIDTAAHAGAHNFSPYYLLYPPLQWGETQMITLNIVLTADGNLIYDRAFDGHRLDRFILLVNGKERHGVTHSAGHHWVTDTIPLRAGANRISWVMITTTYTPPTFRNGISVATTAPKVPRSFRLCRVSVQNVTVFPGGTVGNRGVPPYADLDAGATTTFTPRNGFRGQVRFRSYGTVGYKAKNAISNMLCLGTTTFQARSNTNAQALLLGNSSFTQNGAISFTHGGNDFPMELTTTGALTVEIPINTPQAVSSLIVPLKIVSFTMNTPFFVNGKPITPKYQDIQTTNVTTAGGYTYADPISVTSINHLLPVTPKYRWVATDIIGADDDQILSWPEHAGTAGLNWVSTAPYGPTIQPHEHFNDQTDDYNTYSRSVHFYSHNVEHMWLNMPATAFPTAVTNLTAFQPYTWMFVAMMHPLGHHHQEQVLGNTLLDSYLNGATPTDFTDSIDNNLDVTSNDGTGTNRSTIRFNANQATIACNSTTPLKRNWKHNNNPVVYTGTFMGAAANSSLIAYGQNYYQRINGPLGAGSNYQQGFLLGRAVNEYRRVFASTMTIFEVAFFNRNLTVAEIKRNSHYLMGVYKVEKYH